MIPEINKVYDVKIKGNKLRIFIFNIEYSKTITRAWFYIINQKDQVEGFKRWSINNILIKTNSTYEFKPVSSKFYKSWKLKVIRNRK